MAVSARVWLDGSDGVAEATIRALAFDRGVGVYCEPIKIRWEIRMTDGTLAPRANWTTSSLLVQVATGDPAVANIDPAIGRPYQGSQTILVTLYSEDRKASASFTIRTPPTLSDDGLIDIGT